MALIDKLTNIAGKIRTLLGSSDGMSLVAMSDNLGEVVNECDTQAELIRQIKTELSSKAAGSGSSGDGGVTLLYRAEVTEPVSLIDINIQEEWKQCFAWLVRPCQLTFSTGEWLCFSTNVGGNNYIGANGGTANTVFDVKHSEMIFSFDADKAYFTDINPTEFDSAKLTRIRFTPYYYDKNTIISGAIEIYGVKL